MLLLTPRRGTPLRLLLLLGVLSPLGAQDPPAYTISTLAGTGEPGYDGDDRPATASRTNWARDVAVAPDGSVYFADHYNWRVRRVRTDGIVETVAGIGEHDYTGDGGPAREAAISRPRGLTVTAGGILYFCDTWNHVIRRVDRDGIIQTVCGTGAAGWNGDGLDALETQLDRPTDVAVGADGSIYISDAQNQRIRRVRPDDGKVETVAGNGDEDFSGDGGKATDAALDSPSGIALGPDGALYIADEDNHRIRRVKEGTIETAVGSGSAGLSPDDVAPLEADLRTPQDVFVGPDGTIYVADSENHRVALVPPGGNFRVLAGDGSAGYTGDDGPAREARMNDPKGIAVGPDGSMYVAEAGNFVVRKLAPAPAGPARFRRGDVDLSGGLAITDPILILNALFIGEVVLPCPDAADADDTGTLTLTDAIYLLRFQFLGTEAPPPPFPDCGIDATDDALDCEGPGGCGT